MIELAVAKLQAVPNFTDPTLAFIHNFTYTLGHDDLIAFGAKQYVKNMLNCDEEYIDQNLDHLIRHSVTSPDMVIS